MGTRIATFSFSTIPIGAVAALVKDCGELLPGRVAGGTITSWCLPFTSLAAPLVASSSTAEQEHDSETQQHIVHASSRRSGPIAEEVFVLQRQRTQSALPSLTVPPWLARFASNAVSSHASRHPAVPPYGGDGSRSSDSAAAAKMTALITRQDDLYSLTELVDACPDRLNHIHISACLTRLAALRPPPEHSAQVQALAARLLSSLIPKLKACSIRELANTLSALGKLNHSPSPEHLQEIIHTLTSPSTPKRRSGPAPLDTASPIHISAIFTGAAKLGVAPDSALWHSAVSRALDLALRSELEPRQVASVAWSVAKTRLPANLSGPLMQALGELAEVQAGDMTTQGLVMVCWALATSVGVQTGGALWRRMLLHVSRRPDVYQLSPQEVVMAVSAIASAPGPTDRPVLQRLLTSALRRPTRFSSLGLANLLRSLADAGLPSQELIPLAAALLQPARQAGLSGADLAMAATALAHAGVLDEPALRLLTPLTMRLLARGAVDPHSLAMLLWAVAKAGVPAPELAPGLRAAATPEAVAAMPASVVAAAAWAVARLGTVSTELADALAAACQSNVAELNHQGVANAAWAFAKLGRPRPDLMASLAAHTMSAPEQLTGIDLHLLAWAFRRLPLPSTEAQRALVGVLMSRAEALLPTLTPQQIGQVMQTATLFGDPEAAMALARNAIQVAAAAANGGGDAAIASPGTNMGNAGDGSGEVAKHLQREGHTAASPVEVDEDAVVDMTMTIDMRRTEGDISHARRDGEHAEGEAEHLESDVLRVQGGLRHAGVDMQHLTGSAYVHLKGGN